MIESERKISSPDESKAMEHWFCHDLFENFKK